MATVLTDNQHYSDIANAIRAKGVSGTFLPSEMAAAITSIPSGEILPDEYQEIESITGDGATGYIEITTMYPSNDYELTVDYRLAETGAIKVIAASRRSTAPNYFINVQQVANGSIQGIVGDQTSNATYSSVIGAGNRATITLTKNKLEVNGTGYSITPLSERIVPEFPIMFLARRYSANPQIRSYSDGTIYGAEDSFGKYVCVRRKSDSKAGLFHFGENRFHPATGTVIKGADVISAQDFLNRLEAIL